MATASLIIAAHNEEATLRAKLENALAMDYPAERLDIIVVSDASTDGTDRIAAEFAARGVRLHRQETRGGKTEAQNRGCALGAGAVPRVLRRQQHVRAQRAQAAVGAFCRRADRLRLRRAAIRQPRRPRCRQGRGLYWRYEQFLKRRESLLSSALGANGAIYALRRELFVELRGDIISDFVAPLYAWRRGFRIAYEPTAVATEYSSARFGDEFRRRRRIVSRSLYGLWTEAGVLNPFAHFFFALQMFSHKVLRWLVPVWLLVVLAVNIPLAASEYYGLLLALQVAFYGLAALGLLLPERLGRYWLFYVPTYFTATNLGTLLGLLNFLTGRRHRVWQPTR